MFRAPLIVFSHLRWDFVYQRPQHLMERLGSRRNVFFVEESVPTGSVARMAITCVAPGVQVWRPEVPGITTAFDSSQHSELLRMLRDALAHERITDFVAWLYTPMAVGLARAMKPRSIVYDCMDDLAGFLGAPAEMEERETELLGCADVVFTGGPSLYRARAERHAFVRCFPSSVDADHFSPAVDSVEPLDQRHIPHPRLGYYGVIDERMDLALIATIADKHPEWQIVMVGPTVKIDPVSLPRRANIHWLGPKSYAELPTYLQSWDVCLIPFALGRATRFISPTKVLEYMAAEKTVVSTWITDVAEPYGNVAIVARDHDEFVAGCETALSESPAARAVRRERAQRILQTTSWDATVNEMDAILRCLSDSGRWRESGVDLYAPTREIRA